MNLTKKFFFLAFLSVGIRSAMAQDVQLSQYYNLIQYANPAFVGSSYGWRATLQSRLQWPGLESRYATSIAALDYNVAKYRSGVGALFLADDQGASTIKSYQGIVQYAYQVNLSTKSTLRVGMSAGFVRRILENANLYYPGQFTGAGFNNSDNIPQYSKNYFDLGAGLLFFTKHFWLGISGAHLNRPNQSFLGATDRLPTRFDFLAGYKIVLKAKATMRYLAEDDEDIWALYPSILFKTQGKSDQLDVGLYSMYDIFLVGIWYRGLPVKNYSQELVNNEALIAMIGFRFHQFSVSYSYDFSISKLAPYSKGAHEISLNYLMPKKNKSKYKYKVLPCPRL
jgi:type IX secretion system PorP/SprF family membrane protein